MTTDSPTSPELTPAPTPAPAPELTTSTPAASAGDAARDVHAWRSPAAWILLLCVLVTALVIDLSSKSWAFANVVRDFHGQPVPVVLDREELMQNQYWRPPDHDGVHVLPWDLLDLRLVINRGAVFGIGANRRFMFIAFTFAALAAGMYLFARRTTSRQWLAHVALALILAGGLGNLYDRIVFSAVRDFLHMFPGWHLPLGWHYPRFLGGGSEIFPWVFNGADVMLLAGMVLLLFHINRLEKYRKKTAPPADTAGEARVH